MAEECTYYYYDHGYCCRLLKNSGKDYEVSDEHVHRYCWGYNYDDCPYYQNRSDMSSSSSSGCYLTSACVHARNLPDDCEELQTLRRFRDSFMRHDPKMEKDVEEYYRIAPSIVLAINKTENPREVWNTLYDELVNPCVTLIKKGDNVSAYKRYKEYAQMLVDQFGI